MHAVNNGLVPILLALEYGFETTYEYLAIGVPVELAAGMEASAESARDVLRVLSWVYVGLFFAAIALWLRHQRRVIAQELVGERGRGVISASEERLASRFGERSRHYLVLVRAGRIDEVRRGTRLYGELADLAFAKRRGADPERIAAKRRYAQELSAAGRD
jgi:hypothetical protein